MKTILLIDDNADVRMVITEVLELSNYRVLAAADGKEGILLARVKRCSFWQKGLCIGLLKKY